MQLGVGLHVGTALLQLYGEFGLQPLVRTLGRIKGLFCGTSSNNLSSDLRDRFALLEHKFEIFQVQLFYEYKRFVIVNAGFAVALASILAVLAFFAQADISEGMEWTTVAMVALSLLPAPATVVILWYEASKRARAIKSEADDLLKLVMRAMVN